MNLLIDDFISTTTGKISLKTLLTSEQDYQLQYFFDETQLAMLQMLSSLATVVLKPSLAELRGYLKNGVSDQEYNDALTKVDTKWFDEKSFMRSNLPEGEQSFNGAISKLVTGIESSSTGNASGLFSDINDVDSVCPSCTHVLNFNLHMNVRGDFFGASGATGIRGGGVISTLIAGKDLKTTILSNTIAIDFFDSNIDVKQQNNKFMWQEKSALQSDIYYAHKIGLQRGLFALAYHIDFPIIDKPCVCDVCGHSSIKSVTSFNRLKYRGHYGSTKAGRDKKAGLWTYPYTPTKKTDKGIFSISANDPTWRSWENFTGYVLGQETNTVLVSPAFIIKQYLKLKSPQKINLLIGGNILSDKASVLGGVYDLYSMPENWDKDLDKVTQVINVGLSIKELLSLAFNKIFSKDKDRVGYDPKFLSAIKSTAIKQYTSNAQQIVQQLLLDVDKTDARQMRKDAVKALQQEASNIYSSVMRKYQHDLPLFKALIKGEVILRKKLAS